MPANQILSMLPPRASRPRIAAPLAPPVLLPSLIPFDVLQAYEREVDTADRAAHPEDRVMGADELGVEDVIETGNSGMSGVG